MLVETRRCQASGRLLCLCNQLFQADLAALAGGKYLPAPVGLIHNNQRLVPAWCRVGVQPLRSREKFDRWLMKQLINAIRNIREVRPRTVNRGDHDDAGGRRRDRRWWEMRPGCAGMRGAAGNQ